MRNKAYREELKKLNDMAWSFYRRHVSHQFDKNKTSIERTMKLILKGLEYLIEESEGIGQKIEKEKVKIVEKT